MATVRNLATASMRDVRCETSLLLFSLPHNPDLSTIPTFSRDPENPFSYSRLVIHFSQGELLCEKLVVRDCRICAPDFDFCVADSLTISHGCVG